METELHACTACSIQHIIILRVYLLLALELMTSPCSLTHDVGAVAGLRFVKDAAAVARAVLKYTKHTLLAGELGNH